MTRQLITQILTGNPAAPTVLDFKASTGYRRVGELTRRGLTWREGNVETDYADGDDWTTAVQVAATMTRTLKIIGGTHLVVDQRLDTLIARVSGEFAWREGVLDDGHGQVRTWLARHANVTASLTQADVIGYRCMVVLEFKVQPTPSVEVL